MQYPFFFMLKIPIIKQDIHDLIFVGILPKFFKLKSQNSCSWLALKACSLKLFENGGGEWIFL